MTGKKSHPLSIFTFLYLALSLLLLGACAVFEVDVERTPTPGDAATPTSTTVTLVTTTTLPATRSPVQIPLTSTLRPVPTSEPTALPALSTVIGPGNAAQVTQVASLGKGRAHDVAWSPDGQMLAVASLRGIDLYDVATLDLKRGIQDSGSALYVAFSPDGKLLASAPGDDPGPVRLCDAGTGELLRVLEPSPHTAHEVVFSPDGEMVASRIGLSNGVVRLWDVATGQVVRDLPGAGMANSLAMSPDGRLVAAAGPFHGNVVDVWEVASGQKILTLEHGANLSGVAFSPDGKTLASTGYDKVVVIWDLETGQLVQRLLGPASEMLNIAFSPDGRWLAAGTNDGTLILWDAATGEARLLPGHSGWISSLAFSPDGQTLASSSFDTTVSLSNLATGQVRTIQGYTHFIDEVAVGAGGRLLVTNSGVPVLWDLTSGQASRLSGFAGSQWTADITPDGTRLATGGSDRNVNLWDGVTGQFLSALEGHGDMVRKLAFNAEGDLLASGSDDGTVIVWDVASGQPRQTWTGGGKPLFSLAFSADDRWLAAGIGPDVTVWDVDSGQVQATLEGYVSTAGRGYSSAASDLAFSPDGKLLATAGLDREHSVQLWDVASGQLLDRLQGQTSGAMGVAFSPDGRVLATGNPFYQVVLWDVATGQALVTLDGHTDLVVDVAFSPDGTVLASGSYDGAVRVWGAKHESGATTPTAVALATATGLPARPTPAQTPPTPTPVPPPSRTPTVAPEGLPRPVPTPTDTLVSPQVLSFEVTPAQVDPGEAVTLTWETSGDWATICPSARFALFSSDDCQQVSPSGVTTFTIPLEAAGFQFISFSLSVQGQDASDTQVSGASVALKCDTTWFFSDEPQAGICPTEPVASYAAAQRFERGMMIWLEQLGRYIILDERLVYEHDVRRGVHFVHDPLEIVRDTSAEINPPEGLYAPESGFGLVWRGDVSDSSGFREILGWALAPEFGYEAMFQCDDALPSGGRSWQTCYLKGPDDKIIVFHPLGGWYLLDGGLRCVTLSEVSIEICFPANYSLAKNAEAKRRGSFASYDFEPLGGYQTPYLKEIQFFSEASIAEFTGDCDDSTPCFFGDYPDLDRYRGQRDALRMLTGYHDFELQSFNGRPFLVVNRLCYVDECVIREYTTFLGDVKVDIWMVMADASEIEGSDQLITQLIIQGGP